MVEQSHFETPCLGTCPVDHARRLRLRRGLPGLQPGRQAPRLDPSTVSETHALQKYLAIAAPRLEEHGARQAIRGFLGRSRPIQAE